MKHSNITNNKDLKRFEMSTDGHTSFVDYRMDNQRTIALLHTEVPAKLKGGGVGTELVKKVLAQVAEDNMKVVPACSFVIRYMERNPDTKSLLATGGDSAGK